MGLWIPTPFPPIPSCGTPWLFLRFQVRVPDTSHTMVGPWLPPVCDSQPQVHPSSNPSGFMAPVSDPGRWHLLPHLPEFGPRTGGLHRPHFRLCQCRGCGHAHCRLCRDCAGPATGEARLGGPSCPSPAVSESMQQSHWRPQKQGKCGSVKFPTRGHPQMKYPQAKAEQREGALGHSQPNLFPH